MAVDDSPGTNKAIKYGVRVAQAFDNEVEILTVSKNKNISTGSAKAIKRAKFLISGEKAKVTIFADSQK